jgi:hypothetical protein
MVYLHINRYRLLGHQGEKDAVDVKTYVFAVVPEVGAAVVILILLAQPDHAAA